MKYESLITYHSEVIANVNFFYRHTGQKLHPTPTPHKKNIDAEP